MKKLYRERLFERPKYSNASGWVDQHMQAVSQPRAGLEKTFIEMLSGWLGYADAHSQEYSSSIGEDGVLGAQWAQIGAALRSLLNGDMGRLDCGTLDSLIAKTLESQDFNPDQL